MPFNWIDWLIIAVIIYYIVRGWQTGLILLGSSLIAFATSLWLAVVYHQVVADFLGQKFGLPPMWTFVLGYVLVALVAEAILSTAAEFLLRKLPKKVVQSLANNGLGAVVSGLNGLSVVAFFLVVIVALPLRGTVKSDIRASFIGSRVLAFIESYGGPIKVAADQMRQEAQKFLTIKPESSETLNMDVAAKPSDLRENPTDEAKMLALVNAERAKVGAPALVADTRIAMVARSHSRDMFMQRYFAHVDPQGKNVGDRLDAVSIPYTIAGENLAYAPDVDIAHEGLMNSPEHKENLLDPKFKRVGIGIISTDSYGSMYTQDFAN